jgi:hypothetical protein
MTKNVYTDGYKRQLIKIVKQPAAYHTKAGPPVAGLGTTNIHRQPNMTTEKNNKTAKIKSCCREILLIIVSTHKLF